MALNGLIEANVMIDRFFQTFPAVKEYMATGDTDLSPTRLEPINKPLLRTDGRVCLVEAPRGQDLKSEWWTWCGEVVNQAGWDGPYWYPTCLACIANKE